jgi:hypothetical protein
MICDLCKKEVEEVVEMETYNQWGCRAHHDDQICQDCREKLIQVGDNESCDYIDPDGSRLALPE